MGYSLCGILYIIPCYEVFCVSPYLRNKLVRCHIYRHTILILLFIEHDKFVCKSCPFTIRYIFPQIQSFMTINYLKNFSLFASSLLVLSYAFCLLFFSIPVFIIILYLSFFIHLYNNICYQL